jgi:hypothetical protein
MRIVWILLGAVSLYGGDERGVRPEVPAAVRPIVELARTASPEMFGDTVIRLVQTGKIPQRETQMQLLEEAFTAASGAAEPVRPVAIPMTPLDTRALFRSSAGELRLDALSLQSRILMELLTLDRARTRELFGQIPRPALEPRGCADPLVADVSAYYEIAAAVAQSAFTAEEKKNEAHVQFLMAILAGAKSPGEIEPFARALESVALQPLEMELLLAAVAEKLQTVATDYRPFALTLTALQGEIAALAAVGGANGLATEGLTNAFRNYVTTQLAAARCGPDFGPSREEIAVTPPLSGDEIKPAKRSGETFQAEPYFQSDDSRRMGAALNNLRFGANASAAEWRNMLADFLRDFKSWTPPGSEIDVFHQRMTVLGSLLQILPGGGDRDRILNLAVNDLASDVERQNPAEWLWQLKKLLRDAGPDAAKMLRQFRAANDVGLVLYAAMN